MSVKWCVGTWRRRGGGVCDGMEQVEVKSCLDSVGWCREEEQEVVEERGGGEGRRRG